MKWYKYKIQWVLRPKEAIAVLKIIGVNALDQINFLDSDLKRIGQYDKLYYDKTEEIIKGIRKVIKGQATLFYIELYKK